MTEPAPAFDRPLTHTLITGASLGVGLELARLFAAAGNPLVLVARGAGRLAALADTLRRDYEVDVRVLVCDLAAPDAVAELVARLDEEGVGIRHLVNNAGIGAYGPFAERDDETYRRLLDLNVMALTSLTRRLLPPLVAARHAGFRGVMNVASTAAFQPGPLMAVYFASKAYVLSFSEALAEEMRGTGVTVSAFCPGPTRTEFFARDAMIPPDALGSDGRPTPAALARYERRDAHRMGAAAAARIGYAGYVAGKVIVIPGRRNKAMSYLPRLLPRALIRRVVHASMRK